MKIIFYILFSCLFVSTGLASYTYEVYTYRSSETLYTGESILFADEGGMDKLTLTINSSAIIEGTSPLKEGKGGLWQIILANDSHLDLFSGEVHEIDISHNATATLKGGLIESIYSYQIVPDPHIKLYYSGELPDWNTDTRLLTGLWGSGDPFSIYLHDTGYDAYGNFEFILIPEPVTLVLFGLGGLLVRRKR